MFPQLQKTISTFTPSPRLEEGRQLVVQRGDLVVASLGDGAGAVGPGDLKR